MGIECQPLAHVLAEDVEGRTTSGPEIDSVRLGIGGNRWRRTGPTLPECQSELVETRIPCRPCEDKLCGGGVERDVSIAVMMCRRSAARANKHRLQR